MSTPIDNAIKTYLTDQRNLALDDFSLDDPLLGKLYDNLKQIDLNKVKQQFYEELVTNCEQYWLEAIEPIDGLVFEFDSFHRTDTEAAAYGLMFDDQNGFKVQAEPYSIDYRQYSYSFAALLEAAPGVTLRLANSPAELDILQAVINAGSFYEVKNEYLFTAFLALHLAISDFVKTTAFEKLIRNSPFHFLIQEHDMGISHPLYIID